MSSVRDGWAKIEISEGDQTLFLSASYTPDDSIRNFVDAVASLGTMPSAECCWYQEPGEIHWKFRRHQSLVVEVVRFDGAKAPGRHTGSGLTLFAAESKWDEFAASVLRALQQTRSSMGDAEYQREWRYPFPQEAYDKLAFALREATMRK
jgi:hypothetical protein